MAVHVSLHDVSPAWEREVAVALEMAHEAGARPALLVVPNFHGEALLTDHPPFVDRLRALEADGHEIYLHGYYHRARVETSGSLLERAKHGFAQKIVSGGEAEFSDVSRDEAVKRLDDGERMLRECGLTIRGFIAPAWSMPGWVLELLAERGYRFSEDHLRIYDPAAKRTALSLVLNFASRTPARLLSSVAFCRIATPAKRVVPARIAVHPADMRFALLRQEVARLLRWGRGDFVATGASLFSA
jgi:uncharacterized protein